MLKASKSIWFEKLFFIYNQNLLRRRFNSLKVSGFENLTNKESQTPTIIYANHSGWWDGLVSFHLCKKADLDYFVMMEEKQLKSLQLFRKLGAFSVVRENLRDGVKSLNYAVELLKDDPSRTLCLFPQGEILPNDFRPISFYNGISRIVEKIEKCQIFCVAMRYEFLGNFKPDIFLKVDEIKVEKSNNKFDSKTFTKYLAENLTGNLEKLRKDILKNNLRNYNNII